jgi:predicted component of type VI protein secretion system
MPAQLVALDAGPNILLDKPILLLGRHPECDIQIDSRKISRRHCCIAQVSDYLVVRDLGSTNGIRINGIRLVEGRLSPGDELTIGNNRYKVNWDVVAAASPPTPARKPTVHQPSPPAVLDDEMLESCDDPVPLAEPVESVHPVGPVSPPVPPPPPQDGPLLPDELELMPRSDVFPNPAQHTPPSGIHN